MIISFMILSFLASFKAILIEGSEVVIIALMAVRKLGKNNVFAGVILAVAVTLALYFILQNIFRLFNPDYVSIVAGLILMYFGYRFGRGFYKYYFKKRSFSQKMENETEEVIEKSLSKEFNKINIVPIFMATLVEGTEATLIVAASGATDPRWAMIGAGTGILVLIVFAAVSYKLLMKVPRWMLDLIGFLVLTTFGILFLISGVTAIFF